MTHNKNKDRGAGRVPVETWVPDENVTPEEHRSFMRRVFDQWFHGRSGAEREAANVELIHRTRHLSDGSDRVAFDAETVRIDQERKRRKPRFRVPPW